MLVLVSEGADLEYERVDAVAALVVGGLLIDFDTISEPAA
jgi:hypothetical protein